MEREAGTGGGVEERPEGVAIPAPEGRQETDIRDLVEQEVRLALQRATEQGAREGAAAGTSEPAELESLRSALAASQQEAESLRAEKTRLEREAFITQQVRALGVENVELACRAVKEDIVAKGDRNWVAVVNGGEVPATQYLAEFVRSNPELLPARRTYGGGVPLARVDSGGDVDLDEIRPGMDAATLQKVRAAIGRVMGQRKGTL